MVDVDAMANLLSMLQALVTFSIGLFTLSHRKLIICRAIICAEGNQ